MDGLINLHKPAGISSAKSLYRVRSITGQRKSGHAGTLDPGASGVLVLCLGRATKLVEAIMEQPKVYRASARLDVTSESFDADRALVPVEPAGVPSREQVAAAFSRFEGEIQQIPPSISAVKVGGVPAYKLVRRDRQVSLTARTVRVYWLHLHAFCWPSLEFEMCCGRGTYVRSLIRDLGEMLGTGGCLTGLVRSRVGPYALEDAWPIERLAAETESRRFLIELDRARESLTGPALRIPIRPGNEERTVNGE